MRTSHLDFGRVGSGGVSGTNGGKSIVSGVFIPRNNMVAEGLVGLGGMIGGGIDLLWVEWT